MNHLERLYEEQGNTIRNVCNIIGCAGCHLKRGDSCKSLDLQDEIIEIEYPTNKEVTP